MSFRCQKCNGVRPDGAHLTEFRPTRVVTKICRYTFRPGFDILEEKIVCATCVPTMGLPKESIL